MKNNLSRLTSLLLCVIIAISSLSFASCSNANSPSATSAKEKETTGTVETTAAAPTEASSGTDPETPSVSETSGESVAPETESSPSDSGAGTTEEETPYDHPCNSTVSAPLETLHTPVASSETEIATETQLMPTESTPSFGTSDMPIPPETPEVGDFSLAATQGLRSAVSVYCLYNGETSASIGAGVIYKLDPESGSAFIITNFHVVYSDSVKNENKIIEDIRIYLFGLEYIDYAIPATFVGGSPNNDIAILHVENSELIKSCYESGSIRPITVANSDTITPGQKAIAVGNPEAGGISVTEGVVSVVSERTSLGAINGLNNVEVRVIRIDTAVNSGNSGGGLFNSKGELIGIVNAKIKRDGVENIGYAIPSNVVRAIADNIIHHCYGTNCKTAMRGMLGVTITIGSIATSYDEETQTIVVTQSIIVNDVVSGGLADGILKPGDIIRGLSINGRKVAVSMQHHLIDAMFDVRVGDTVEITVIRDGSEMTVSTVITEDCLVEY